MKAFSLFLLMIFLCLYGCHPKNDLILTGRTQIQTEQGSWKNNFEKIVWEPEETAVIICDMWDKHWCEGATRRVTEMAPRMNEVIQSARGKGITIIHAPSGTMDFYTGYPQRVKIKMAPYDLSSDEIKDWYYPDPEKESELPIDDSDGGCDSNPEPENVVVWTRQIQELEIADKDGISDSGREINNYLIAGGIKNIILMGVHINMCVLGRPFGIRAQISQGRNVILVRDLTDSMYNPEMPPYVKHDEGTRLVIKHIERYWCPSIESNDLM